MMRILASTLYLLLFGGAFLKMQFAIEDAERNKAQKNRSNPNLILKDQNDADAYLYSIILKQLEILKNSKNNIYNVFRKG